MPETWSHCNGKRAAPDTAPTPFSRYPQTLGSCCGCWWHQENKAPSSCPSHRHFEFRAPNSLHTLPLKQHPKALPLLKSPASSKSLGHTGRSVPHL